MWTLSSPKLELQKCGMSIGPLKEEAWQEWNCLFWPNKEDFFLLSFVIQQTGPSCKTAERNFYRSSKTPIKLNFIDGLNENGECLKSHKNNYCKIFLGQWQYCSQIIACFDFSSQKNYFGVAKWDTFHLR